MIDISKYLVEDVEAVNQLLTGEAIAWRMECNGQKHGKEWRYRTGNWLFSTVVFFLWHDQDGKNQNTFHPEAEWGTTGVQPIIIYIN